MTEMPEHVTLDELCWAVCMTKEQVLAMVESGELPPPNSNGRWHWRSVDDAMTGDDNEDLGLLHPGRRVR